MTTSPAAWSLNAMTYATATFSPKQLNSEPAFNQMALSGLYTNSLNLFNGQSADNGYVHVVSATTTSITVRLKMDTELSF